MRSTVRSSSMPILSSLAPWHLNDMLVDHDGRAWVGNFGFDLMGGAASPHHRAHLR